MRQRGGSYGSNLVGFIIIFIFLYGLYYLYNWLYASQSTAVVQVGGINMPMSMTTATNGGVNTNVNLQGKTNEGISYVVSQELSGLADAGQYSTNMWVYVIDTKGFAGSSARLANLLEINSGKSTRFDSTPGNRGKTLLYIGLNPKNAALVVRQSTMDSANSIDNTLDSPDDKHPSSIFPLSSLINEYNGGTTYSGNDRCDIVNGIEFQRWVLISTVANGRTLDVYIDGKLARSCVYTSGYSGGSGGGTAYVGMDNGNNLKGFFSYINFYNYAQSPEEVWRIYQTGPGGPFNFTQWLGSFFSVNVTANGDALNSMNPCTACTG